MGVGAAEPTAKQSRSGGGGRWAARWQWAVRHLLLKHVRSLLLKSMLHEVELGTAPLLLLVWQVFIVVEELDKLLEEELRAQERDIHLQLGLLTLSLLRPCRTGSTSLKAHCYSHAAKDFEAKAHGQRRRCVEFEAR